MLKSITALSFAAVIAGIALPGCSGQSKPDPRTRPDFVDTTDPSKVSLPAPPTGAGGAANHPGQPGSP
jgi:hypothetical protein